METGFALTAFLSVILNLFIPEEIEDEETPEITANDIDEEKDQAEWNHIRRKSTMRPSSEVTPAIAAKADTEREKEDKAAEAAV